MRTIKVVVLLVRQLQHGFTKNAKVSPNLTVTHICFILTLYIMLRNLVKNNNLVIEQSPILLS